MINEKMSLAMCIPTYNRSNIIEELLCHNFAEYQKSNIDVYIYDSSESSGTEDIVRHWMLTYHNLYYIRMPSEMHSGMKVYKIYQKFGLMQEYDYLWMCGDTLRFSKEALLKIQSFLNASYDIIVVDMMDPEKIGTKEYDSLRDFFCDCAWFLTLFGGCVLNTKRMLQNVAWEMLTEKYGIRDRINYSHIGFYFEHMLNLSDFKALHESFTVQEVSKVLGCQWRKEMLFIQCHCWPATIWSLPDYYNDIDKACVIKKLEIFSGSLTKKNILALKKEGYYNSAIFNEYKKQWTMLTDIPLWYLAAIAFVPLSLLNWIVRYSKTGRQYARLFRKMERFSKKYSQLYIYGAGACACRYAGYLDKRGIAYKGFLVTEKNAETVSLMGYPVSCVSDVLKEGKEVGIILAVNPKNEREIEPVLKKIGIWDSVFYLYVAD